LNRRTAVKLIAAAALTLACILSFLGRLDPGFDLLGGSRLKEGNDRYLASSFNRAITGFGVLSVLKAGLDIIEGSEVGASFGATANLELGDLVQPAYDYVDIAWRTMLVSCVALLGTRYALEAADLMDSHVLTFTLITGLAVLLLQGWRPGAQKTRRVLRDVLGVSIVATVALYYLLPLSVWGASRLSGAITAPAIGEAEKGFQETRESLFPDDPQIADGWLEKMKSIRERIEQTGTYLKEKTEDLIVWTVKLIAGYLFDCIVFPVLLFLLLLWLTRAVMRYVSHRNLQRTLNEDLQALLTRSKRSTAP